MGGFLLLNGNAVEEAARGLGDLMVGGECSERGVDVFRRFGDLNCSPMEIEDVSDSRGLLT